MRQLEQLEVVELVGVVTYSFPHPQLIYIPRVNPSSPASLPQWTAIGNGQ